MYVSYIIEIVNYYNINILFGRPAYRTGVQVGLQGIYFIYFYYLILLFLFDIIIFLLLLFDIRTGHYSINFRITYQI